MLKSVANAMLRDVGAVWRFSGQSDNVSGRTFLEVIRAFAHSSAVAVVITDATVEKPGPIIRYANDAFGRLIGRSVAEVIGLSPRFMQGRETRRSVLDTFEHALKAGERFHGYLTNYRVRSRCLACLLKLLRRFRHGHFSRAVGSTNAPRWLGECSTNGPGIGAAFVPKRGLASGQVSPLVTSTAQVVELPIRRLEDLNRVVIGYL